MTQRERQTPNGGAPRTPRPVGGGAAPASPGASPPDTSLWDTLYQSASPAQQKHLLGLAARQGVLYTHQAQAVLNAPPLPGRQVLPALLKGQVRDLEPVRPPEVDCEDQALDEAQRRAVARALHTPDVCLIQGYPGTGKSRVVAEIIRQATFRGERVLFVAPSPAALDRVLEQVGDSPWVCGIRCPGADERAEALPPPIRRLTFAERVRFFHEQTVPSARRAVLAARNHLAQLRQEEACWQRLQELADRHDRLVEQEQALRAKPLEDLSEASCGIPNTPYLRELAACRSRRDETLVRLDSRLAEIRAEREKLRGEGEQVEAEWNRWLPLGQARQQGRWWTGSWWRALLQKNLDQRVQEGQKRREEIRSAQASLAAEWDQRTRERLEEESRFEREQARLRREEEARLQAVRDDQLAALLQELKRVREKGQAGFRDLSSATRPPELTVAAVQVGREAWLGALHTGEQKLTQTEQWARGLEEAQASFAEYLESCANLVAATLAHWPADPQFGERAFRSPKFDLLIVEEADQVTEAEFLKAARPASRWVLVGEPEEEVEDATATAPKKPLPAAGRSVPRRPGFFQRLWQHLHGDPRRLPNAWFLRQGRLRCCLRRVPPEQQQWVETETVADRPDVELKILTPPRQAPQLAEVIFPATTTICEAKEYIFRELEELPVQARGHSLTWREDPDHVTLLLGPVYDPDAIPAVLARGIREQVRPREKPVPAVTDGPAPWQTCRLEFERASGWDRVGAEQWVAEHLHLRDLGRTALLTVPYRSQPDLALVLSDLLYAENGLAAEGNGASHPENWSAPAPAESGAVEFVAVPSLGGEWEEPRPPVTEGGWRGGASTAVAPRLRAVNGAGLETDLTDPRRLDPLPQDLRAALPRHGLVNWLEARAVLQTLESLVAGGTLTRQGQPTVIAVMALYPSQVELLRLLVQRHPGLAGKGVRVEVGLPSAFRQRECAIALLSLTRSHGHRAVAYGDDPQALVQALTRASARLMIFGDPGTLLRRSQWHGPVDHLDEASAGRERHLAAQLVRYIQGHGRHPRAFRLREGSCL